MSVVKNSLLQSAAVTFTIHDSVFVCVVSDNEYVNVNPLASSNSVFYPNAIYRVKPLTMQFNGIFPGGVYDCMSFLFLCPLFLL